MRPKATTMDLYLALAATLLGGLFFYLALRARWNPHDVNPGIDGCLTAGVVGTILAILAPMEYWRALLLTAPVMALEYWACAAVGGSALGIVGLHLIIVGFIGLGLGVRAQRFAVASGGEPARREAAAQHG
ncbi:MAG: hypothetical protein QM820_49720 [Minicystis sp.]